MIKTIKDLEERIHKRGEAMIFKGRKLLTFKTGLPQDANASEYMRTISPSLADVMDDYGIYD